MSAFRRELALAGLAAAFAGACKSHPNFRGGDSGEKDDTTYVLRPMVGARDVYDSQGERHVESRGLEWAIHSQELGLGLVLGVSRADVDAPSSATTPDWEIDEFTFGPRIALWTRAEKLEVFAGGGLAYVTGTWDENVPSGQRHSDTTQAGYVEVGLEFRPFSHLVLTLVGRSLWSNGLEISNSKLDPSYTQASFGVGIEF